MAFKTGENNSAPAAPSKSLVIEHNSTELQNSDQQTGALYVQYGIISLVIAIVLIVLAIIIVRLFRKSPSKR